MQITITSPNEDELIAMANVLSPGEEFRAMLPNITKMKEQSVDSSFDVLKPAIRLLLEKGIKLLVVTLGPNGVFICFREGVNLVKHPLKNDEFSKFQRQLSELVHRSHRLNSCTSSLCAFHLPALHASVVSLTGAGDCLVGGILASICSGLDIMRSVAMGIAVAKAAVESEDNVPSEFSLRSVIGMDSNTCILSLTVLYHLIFEGPFLQTGLLDCRLCCMFYYGKHFPV